jgi:hypothetical protein
MYHKATLEIIDKWGYDLDINDEPIEDAEYNVVDINVFPEGEEREKEEARREQFRKKLKKVC